MPGTQTTHGKRKGHHGPRNQCKLVKISSVKVSYLGKTGWADKVVDETPVWLLKENAMRSFGLDLSEAERYVLQYQNADVDDCNDVGDFDEDCVDLTLTLVEEPCKG